MSFKSSIKAHAKAGQSSGSRSPVGPLDRPVTPESAAALHAASAPARHGRREATLLDKRVRDTGEIDANALSLEWAAGALPSLQAEVAQALGGLGLEARLHNLLVYGPGQFFKPHQDTEKHPGMIATLVLVWPSAHIGGELRVCHRDTEVHFASQHLQATAIRWFAFYADCRHEVAPVSEGWRIVLTFDLVLPAETARPRTPVHPPLLDALRAHFHPEGAEPCVQPWVLLLDHEYTERGLRWRLLKGEDRARVAALRAACEPLGDLLFFHRRLRRLVAIELKLGRFKAAHKGQTSCRSCDLRCPKFDGVSPSIER